MGLNGIRSAVERTDGGLTLTSDELLYLLGLFSPEPPLGISNPYLGWYADEIELALDQARRLLERRGILVCAMGSGALVQSPIARMISTCAAPRVALLTRVELPAGYQAISNFYWSYAPLVLELATMHGSDQHHLVPYDQTDKVLERLTHRLGWNPSMAPGVAGGSLPSAEMLVARSLAIHAGVAATRQHLQQAGLPRSAAWRLGDALANPVSVANIALVAPGEGLRREYQVVEEPMGLWWLALGCGDQGERTEVVPLSTVDASQRLRGAIAELLTTTSGHSGPIG